MSIEIHGSQGRPPADIGDQSGAGSVRSRQHAAQTGGTAASSGRPDKVSLTDQAAQLQSLENQIAGMPVVDTERVAEVQQAIATGGYTMDPTRVADKLLEFEAGWVAQTG